MSAPTPAIDPSTGRRDQRPEPVGLEFTERMEGTLSVRDSALPARSNDDAAAGTTISATLLITIPDVDKTIAGEGPAARVTGTLDVSALSHSPLSVDVGAVTLSNTDPADPPGLRRMRYALTLTDSAGRPYAFRGTKVMRDDRFSVDAWADITTLRFTILDGEGDEAPELAAGVLRVDAAGFARQLRSFKVLNAQSVLEQTRVLARFGRFFAGWLFDVYGGVFARQTLFDPDAPPRQKRPLRAPVPEVHPFRTADGLTLRLTRYRGGPKGPVLLVHGLGVSSLMFTIDTIDTNLVEFLTEAGYDVWLIDMRVSIELPYADQPSTADDLARYDLPAAVDAVRAVAGAPDIQAVVHCYGAIAFHMAMLGGLQGVRSAVSSQVGAHIDTLKSTSIKSLLYVPEMLGALGVGSMTMRTDADDGWLDRIYNRALALNPAVEAEERCDNPVCYRVTFLFAPLYEHDQLNNATHAVMHELVGVASMENLQHLSAMARAGHLVDAAGEDVYLPHAERLAIPIAYIHGAENATWLPRSTGRTVEWLSGHNEEPLYRRHLIPLYGHLDCILGKDAARDVYPLILQHLDETALNEA